MSKPIIIVGYGGHASVLVEILIGQGREIVGYTDVKEVEIVKDLKYLGTDNVVKYNYNANDIELVVGVGIVRASLKRKEIFDYFHNEGFTFATVIHPAAIISPSVYIEEGVQIMAGAILQTNVKIGANTIINTASVIEHNCEIAEQSHICPRSVLSGGVMVGVGSLVGVGSIIKQDVVIGNQVTIGAGSVVIRNVNDRKTVYGVPAKEV